MLRLSSAFGLARLAAATAMLVVLPGAGGATPAGPDAGLASRGFDRGDREPGNRDRGQPPAGAESEGDQAKENCPEAAWTLPVQVKGAACLLLLPKPEEDMAAAWSFPPSL